MVKQLSDGGRKEGQDVCTEKNRVVVWKECGIKGGKK